MVILHSKGPICSPELWTSALQLAARELNNALDRVFIVLSRLRKAELCSVLADIHVKSKNSVVVSGSSGGEVSTAKCANCSGGISCFFTVVGAVRILASCIGMHRWQG